MVVFMPLEAPLGGSLLHLLLSEGPGLPSLLPSPPSHLTVLISSGFHKWAVTDEMFRAATMVTAFLSHLGIFHCSG